MGEEEATEPKEMQQPVKQDMEDHGPSPHIHENSALARVEAEKRLALVKAWEENEKAKVDNKAHKKISAIGSWENTKKADVEAQLRSFEEKLEKKRAEYAERMKNKAAELHMEAEEKRAMIEAEKGEEFLKIEETAAKYRSTGYIPKKFLACFSS
ncbi:remorin 1.4-like [Hibiscus syriacus]|uniref:remorin 1.4-like n=1 Tax=Hibiscus syriacus TaxID=106335 RepID=UPI001922CD4F|nr:remorin 1.4-like [Hibiscus syriacus]